MPPALQGIDWDELRKVYIQERLSLEAVAARFGVSKSAVNQRSCRYGWNKDRNKIEQSKSQLVSKVSERIMERSTSKAVEAVASHLERVMTTGGGLLEKLEAKLLSAVIPDITRLDHVESATRSYRSWDDLIRRAHGLSDPTARLDVTTGGLPVHEKALSILQACTKLVRDGQVKPVDIDVTALVHEMGEDTKEGVTDTPTDTKSAQGADYKPDTP